MDICEYSTVSAVKTAQGISGTTDDVILLGFVREATAMIEDLSGKKFYPRIKTYLFDTPEDPYELMLDRELLSLTTLTNGDGTVITSDYYRLYPLREDAKWMIRLVGGMYCFMPSVETYGLADISVAGVWGYVKNYSDAWEDTTTLSTAISSTSATSVTVPTGKLKAGMLIKVDDEWIYISSVSVSTTDTITIVRGVNGSTAATHDSGEKVYVWNPGREISGLCTKTAAALYKLKNNPMGETITVEDQVFHTPRDVSKFVLEQLRQLGLAGRSLI